MAGNLRRDRLLTHTIQVGLGHAGAKIGKDRKITRLRAISFGGFEALQMLGRRGVKRLVGRRDFLAGLSDRLGASAKGERQQRA